jgi:DNA-binding transcriptional MocR family regulator
MADFFTGNRYRRATQSAALIYARRLRCLRDEVIKAFPDGTTCSVPVGGLFLWVALPRSYDTMALYQAALAEGISMSPGRLFTRSRDYRNCMRLSGAAIDEEKPACTRPATRFSKPIRPLKRDVWPVRTWFR